MKAAFVKKDITPLHPVQMAGYERTEPNEGVLDPIQINTLLIEVDSEIFVYTYLDSIMVENEFTLAVRTRINAALSIQADHINVGCIHTHSAPAFFKLLFENTIVEFELQKEAQDVMVESILEAYRDRVEVKLLYGKTMIDGLYGNRNRIDGPADKNAGILRFIDQKGQILVDCINIAVHPTLLNRSNRMLSGDLLGWVRNRYEKKKKIPTMIINGTTGDVSTRYFRKDSITNELDSVSSEIVRQLDELTFAQIEEKDIKYNFVEYSVNSDFSNDPYNQAFINVNENDVMAQVLKRRAEIKAAWGPFKMDLEATCLRIGSFVWISLPGDVVSTFGLKIREALSGDHVLIGCYTNAYTNYIVNQEEYGKYFETALSRCQVGVADRFIETVIQKSKKNVE